MWNFLVRAKYWSVEIGKIHGIKIRKEKFCLLSIFKSCRKINVTFLMKWNFGTHHKTNNLKIVKTAIDAKMLRDHHIISLCVFITKLRLMLALNDFMKQAHRIQTTCILFIFFPQYHRKKAHTHTQWTQRTQPEPHRTFYLKWVWMRREFTLM